MAVVARVEPKNVVKNVASSIRVSPCWVQCAEPGAPHIVAAKMRVCQHVLIDQGPRRGVRDHV